MSKMLPASPTRDILLQHGMNGERLLQLSRRIANDAQRKAPAGLGGKYEDLVSFLAMQALESVAKFDPEKIRPGYTFSSYLCDIMEQRVTDFYRRKSEGFGDRRNGSDGRIVLGGETMDDEEDSKAENEFDRFHDGPPETEEERRYKRWAEAGGSASTFMLNWKHFDEKTMMLWLRGADLEGVSFEQYVVRSVSRYTRDLLGEAA